MSEDKIGAPWKAMEGGGLDRGHCWYVSGDAIKVGRVAEVHAPPGAHSYMEARAKLIAAAPELLTALRIAAAFLAEADITDPRLEAVRAIANAGIAKATAP